MSTLEEVTERLVEFDDGQLILHLGMSVKGISEDVEAQTRGASLDSIDLNYYGITRADEEAMSFGRRLFKRLNLASYELLCKDPFDNGETLQKLSGALEDSTAKAAGFLAPVLVANLGLAPAVAAIIAVLVVKTISKAIADEICSTWKNSFEAVADITPQSAG